MRYIEQFNILVTGSWDNTNITIWSVLDFNELNKATTQNCIFRLEIMSKSNDTVNIITGDTNGQINIWNVNKISENKFSIELITSFKAHQSHIYGIGVYESMNDKNKNMYVMITGSRDSHIKVWRIEESE